MKIIIIFAWGENIKILWGKFDFLFVILLVFLDDFDNYFMIRRKLSSQKCYRITKQLSGKLNRIRFYRIIWLCRFPLLSFKPRSNIIFSVYWRERIFDRKSELFDRFIFYTEKLGKFSRIRFETHKSIDKEEKPFYPSLSLSISVRK